MTLAALTPREASIFACLCDTVVAPGGGLPQVADTDAVRFFDSWLEHSPRLNRAGLRALLYLTELAPRAMGFPGRLRRLSEAERVKALEAAESSPRARGVLKLLKGIAMLSYYGDDVIMRRLGYDPDERIRVARELRAKERRP